MGSLGDMDAIKINGDSNGTVIDEERMERLKNEILNDMKKHMNKIKDEIIIGGYKLISSPQNSSKI